MNSVPKTINRSLEPALIRALRRSASYDHPVEAVQLDETHISWVLLTGPFAYKIKKPVSFPFVDFSTLERRKAFCEEELRLNRRLAPDLYVGVVPIGGSPEKPLLGKEPAFEYAVKMRQFAPAARVDLALAQAGVTAADFAAFAARLARFHGTLPPAPEHSRLGSAGIVIRNALNNLRDLEHAASDAEIDAVATLHEWTEQQCVRLHEAFTERKRGGAIRECHGDMHLQNLVYLDGEIVPFDALEFEPELRWMDVVSESAFVAMDLIAHGRAELAYEFLNRYFEATGDYTGLEVLSFYLVYRALVRAKVLALRRSQRNGEPEPGEIDYIATAAGLASPDQPPLLLITHGLSGSGKTTVSDSLIGGLQAIRIRSDLERKRLHGFAADADTGSGIAAGIYAKSGTAETYATLERYAACGLREGLNVIVDAAFLHHAQREAFRDLAKRSGARFVLLDCTCPEPLLRQRVERREAAHADASEASTGVLDHQLLNQELLREDELAAVVRVDTSRPPNPRELLTLITAAGP